MSEASKKPTIEILGVTYAEAKPKKSRDPMEGVCGACAFWGNAPGCGEAINRSRDVFGGDCMERDVIYVAVAA